MTELEEGEAAFDDSQSCQSSDFDRLSYLGEKVQNVLGHFQKEFEDGGLYTQGLGAIVGDYGTFLPTKQRSPQKPKSPPKPKSPEKVQTHSIVDRMQLLKEGIAAFIPTLATTQRVANVPSQRNENATVGSAKAPDAVANVPSQRNGNSTVVRAKAPAPDAVANVPFSRRNGSATAKAPTPDAVANAPYSLKNGSATNGSAKASAPDAVANVPSQRNGSATAGSAKAPAPKVVANVSSRRNVSATVGSAKVPALDAVANVASQWKGSTTGGSVNAPAKVVEKIPKSHQQATNTPVIRDGQKLLKVRIKFGSEELPQKNTAIYSGLGLMSPSSSTGNSLGDSEGSNTPIISSILQMLTSVVAAGDLLVAPLDHSFRSLKKSKPSKPSTTIKLKRTLSSTSVEDSAQLRYEDAQNRKHSQTRVREMHKVSRGSDGKAFEDDVQLRLKENSGAQMLVRPSNSIANASELNLGKAVETSRGYDNRALSNIRAVKVTNSKTKGNKSVKDEPLEPFSGQSSGKLGHREPKGLLIHLGKKQAINSQKEMTTDYGESARNNAYTNPPPFGDDTYNLEAEKGGKGDASQVIPKRTIKAASSEQNKVRTPDTVTKSSSAGKKTLKGGPVKDSPSQYLAQGSRRAGALFASKGNGMKSNAYETSEDCFGVGAKASNFDTLRDKKGHGRLKENQFGAVVQGPPSDILPSSTGETLVGAPADSVLIDENWVCCDKCQKWRLLPHGILPNQLPDKWLCCMLNWLDNMNHCRISEDETTTAVRALNYLPLPQNHVIGVPAVDQSLSFNSTGNGKKEAYKGKETVDPVSKAKNTQQDIMNRGSSNDKKPFSGGSRPSDKLNCHRLSKPGTAVKSLPGGAMAKKRVKRESDLDDHGIQKRIKSEGTFDVDNFQAPSPYHGNQKARDTDHVSPREDVSGLPSKKRKLKEWMNQSDNLEVDGSHTVPAKEESSDSGFVRDKKLKGSRSDGNESGRRKSNAEPESRIIPAVPKNIIDGNSDISKQQNKMRVKKISGMTLEDLESLKKSFGCEPESTAATSSSSKVSGSRKTRRSYQELKGSPVDSVSSSPMRKSKINKFSPRNDVSVCNNAKVADLSTDRSSRKVVIGDTNHVVKPPVMAKKRKSSDLLKEEPADKVDTGDANHEAKSPLMAKKRRSSDLLKEEHADGPFPETVAALVVTNRAVKRESRKLPDVTREDIQPVEKERSSLKLGNSCNKDAYAPLQQGLMNNSTQEDCRKEKSNVDKALPVGIKLAPATQIGSLPHGQSLDVSSRVQSESCRMMDSSTPVRPLPRDPGSQGRLRKDASSLTSHVVLKEAEVQRAFADQIKASGFGHEYNETYFQASLKFLHGASLLESESEKNKSGELNQLQIYISTANNFETCAHEYERQREMALAALAYKCVEVAYMRVVYCKSTSSSSSRHWHDLQTSLKNVPLGESPSSSASDIDNLNNPTVVENAPLSRGNGSLSGSHAIAPPRTRPNFIRLLDFTKDVNLAMEASTKAHNAFAAAALALGDPLYKDCIAAVKRVMDFSFHDVEEFLRLVRIAVESVESSRRPALALQ